MLRALPKASPVKVAVVIPCTASHVRFLAGIMKLLTSQTSPPDEIVLAVSGVNDAVAKTLRSTNFGPRVRMDVVKIRQNASQNRNRGTRASKGDVIVYQDADDLPHPQRIEVVRHLFSRYDVQHLMHAYARPTDAAWNQPRVVQSSGREATYAQGYQYRPGLTNGNCVVARRLAERVPWPENVDRGQDVIFNRAACAKSNANAHLQWPLILYRQQFSTLTLGK